MANYETIMRLRPEVREFVRNRRWVHRGDVLFYGANTKGEHFSTDQGGFRHSVFKGKTLGVPEILKYPRYGLVLGPRACAIPVPCRSSRRAGRWLRRPAPTRASR